MATGTTTRARALELLGSGVGPEVTASALGVTVSAISQLLSEETFAAEVAELRFKSLQKHNLRDGKYDELEDDLIDRLRDCLPLMHRPMEILKAIAVINAAKRRGASAPEQITHQNTVINLTMPVQIIQKFQVNQHNQVISAGTQELLTIQSGSLLSKIPKKLSEKDSCDVSSPPADARLVARVG